MKRLKQNLAYSEKRRGRGLDATGKGPFIRLGIALMALVVVVLAVIFLILPLIKNGVDWEATFVRRTPMPQANVQETPAVPAILSGRVRTLALDDKDGAAVLVDAWIGEDELVYASGMTEESCDRIVRCDLATGRSKTIAPQLSHDCLRMPRANDEYLVWFDAAQSGGGNICLRRSGEGEDIVLVQLTAGLPALYLDGQYLVFTADAGLVRKLYVIDLHSLESLTLALLEGEDAASAPDIAGGRIVFSESGGVRVASLVDGTNERLDTKGPVHDPRALDDGLLWLSGDHGEDTALQYRAADGQTLILARGVIDARAARGHAIYGRDATVYAYSLRGERFYMLSGAEEYAQLVDARGDYALWRVLTEDGTVYRYLKVN